MEETMMQCVKRLTQKWCDERGHVYLRTCMTPEDVADMIVYVQEEIQRETAERFRPTHVDRIVYHGDESRVDVGAVAMEAHRIGTSGAVAAGVDVGAVAMEAHRIGTSGAVAAGVACSSVAGAIADAIGEPSAPPHDLTDKE